MRLIDADALMDLYANRLELLAERYCPDSSECGVLAGAMKLLEAQPTIEERKTEWIPCSERLPENDKSVLATTAWGGSDNSRTNLSAHQRYLLVYS